MNLAETDFPAHGDHVCATYDTDAEWESLVSAYVRAGLDGGNRVAYFTSERSSEDVLEVLARNGVTSRKPDDLRVIDNGYPERVADFDGEQMVAGLALQIDEARDDGYAGIRFLGEMGWTAGDATDEKLTEYENLVTTYYRSRAVDGLCLFDRRKFPDTVLNHLTGLHPLIAA